VIELAKKRGRDAAFYDRLMTALPQGARARATRLLKSKPPARVVTLLASWGEQERVGEGICGM